MDARGMDVQVGGAVCASQPDRYDRQRRAAGFDQGAVGRLCLVRLLGPGGRDPLGDWVGHLAGSMGVESQVMGCRSFDEVDLDAAEYAMAQNPNLRL